MTVFLTGTQTKATIFSSPSGAPLSNPFTANASTSPDPGGWIFWASQGAAYDIVMSGGIAPNVYHNPITLTGVALGSAVGGSEPANTALMAPSSGPGGTSFRTFTQQDIAQAGTLANPISSPSSLLISQQEKSRMLLQSGARTRLLSP